MNIKDIALNNKYTNWYINIIEKCKIRASTKKEAKILLGNIEAHHIIPKCIIENNNVVYLTPREHFIVHRLLAKMFNGSFKVKMEHAITQFTRGRTLNSHQTKIAMSARHKPCSKSRKLNISISRKNTKKILCEYCFKETDPGNFKRFHGKNCKNNPNIDLEVLQKRSLIAKNSMILQKSNGNYSKPKVPKGIFTCPHCLKQGINYGNMKRFHFDRCKNLKFSDNLLHS